MVATRKRSAAAAKNSSRAAGGTMDDSQLSRSLRRRETKQDASITPHQASPTKTRKKALAKPLRRDTLDEIIPQATHETLNPIGGKRTASVRARTISSQKFSGGTATSKKRKTAPVVCNQSMSIIADAQGNVERSSNTKGPSYSAIANVVVVGTDEQSSELRDDDESSSDGNMIEENLLCDGDRPIFKPREPKVYLSFDVFDLIISFSPDQQSLHAWQLVSFDAYRVATPLLYSRGSTLSTTRGYESFLCGSRLRRNRSDGPACSRTTSKAKLLALVPAIKIAGSIDLRARGLWTFVSTPGEYFESLKKVWIVHDPSTRRDPFVPRKTVVDWFENKVKLAEVHIGTPKVTAIAINRQLLSHARFLAGITMGLVIACPNHPTRPPAVFRHYEGLPLKMDILPLHDTLEIVLSDALHPVYVTERFNRILRQITFGSSPQTVRIFGAGSPPPRQALLIAWNELHLYLNHSATHEILSADISGSEAECQEAVSRALVSLLRLIGKTTRLEFKLHSELPPFFE